MHIAIVDTVLTVRTTRGKDNRWRARWAIRIRQTTLQCAMLALVWDDIKVKHFINISNKGLPILFESKSKFGKVVHKISISERFSRVRMRYKKSAKSKQTT